MNKLKSPKIRLLREAFEKGLSTRAAAEYAGVAKLTAQIYSKSLTRGPCGCGAEAGHRGWCWFRLQRSPKRREFLAKRFGAKIRRPGSEPRPIRVAPKCDHGVPGGPLVCAICSPHRVHSGRRASPVVKDVPRDRPDWMHRLRKRGR